jgi:mannitol operon transcriptional antiterminator
MYIIPRSNHLEHIFTGGYTQVVEYSDVTMIVENNPEVKRIVADNVDILEDLLGRKIQEQEIAYIVIYVCAAIEKYSQYSSNSNVILVCNSGIGTSHLLQQKINEKFNFNIVNVIGAHTLSEMNIANVDFLISTIELQNAKLPYVRISPLLNEEDYIKLRQMSRKTSSKQIRSNDDCGVLTSQVRGILKNYPDLFEQVQPLIKSYFEQKSLTNKLSLSKLLKPEFIEIDVEASDWKDAIKKAALPLLRKGIVTSSYVNAMIQNVDNNGPYIVIANSFALPHAAIDSGSKDVGMSLVRLKNPVPFYSPRFDPVRYVCVLSAVDQEKHLKAFFNLVNLLKINGFLDQLDQAESTKEMADIITRNEMNLF